MSDRFFVHPSAFVDEPCEIGDGAKIWHFCHVMSGARIGRETSLGQNVHVAGGAILGDRVKVQNNVSIYDGVVVEDDVFLGPSCVFTNVTNPRASISRRGRFERTLVRRGATIGANATIRCGVTIGQYAFVAAGCVVVSDVGDYALVMGVPGSQKGWVGRHGHRLEEKGKGRLHCPASGWTYAMQDGVLRCLDWSEDVALPNEAP